MSSRDQILHQMVRSNFVRRTYGAVLPIPGIGTAVRHLAHTFMPKGSRIWIRIPQGLGVGLWMFTDTRDELGYVKGQHEPWMQDLLGSELRQGNCYYDLGAHTGFFSLIAAREVGSSGAVLAVEANPQNARIVETNVARNKLAQITVLEAAIWSSSGRIVFEPNPDSTQGRISVDNLPKPGSCCVSTVSIDELVYRDKRRVPDFIKMDVEGAEWDALQGARRVFSEAKPKLLCEIHHPEQMDQICGFLEGQDYRCEKWNPVDPHSPDYHQLYVWAVPR